MHKDLTVPAISNSSLDMEEQIERLLCSFRVGRTTAVKWNVETDKEEWLAPLRYSRMAHLSQSERDALAKSKIHCIRARNHASALDFSSACREIAIAETLTARADLCREARLMADSEFLAVEAAIE